MRTYGIYVALALMLFQAPALAGESLVNGSFEDGTLNGWTIVNQDGDPPASQDYHDPPITQCTCGNTSGPPGYHQDHDLLYAADGTYFAGLTCVYDTPPVPTGKDILYRQAIDVGNWDVGADRTNYNFEIWSQMGHSYDWDRGGQAEQLYIIWWNDDGLEPPDLTVKEFDHHFKFYYWDCMAFASGTDLSFHNWRKLMLSGSIPDNPQVVVLEIRQKVEWKPSTSHNCFDGVVFSAESATGSSISPFTGDISNSDFEDPPYDTIHYYETPDPPLGWGLDVDSPGWEPGEGLLRKFKSDDGHGPIEGLTNGSTSPTDPLGITTPSGDHFWGRADNPPYPGFGQDLQGHWGHVLPVRNWSPCATGIKYKLHYLTKMWDTNDSGFQILQLCWDNEEHQDERSVLDVPLDPLNAAMLEDKWFPWVEIFFLNDRSTPGASEFSGFDELEQIGEFSPTDIYGDPYAPEYVLLRHKTYVFAGWSHEYPFKWMYDKVDFYIEAIIPDDVRIVTRSPLPDGDCEEPYSVQLIGCVIEPLTFTLYDGILPPGLEMSTDGLISGQATSPGTFVFTVQLEDGTSATTTKAFQITAGGNCCGQVAADFDDDGDVDQEDFGFLQMCITGLGGGIPLPPDNPDCSCADLDHDGLDIDQMDIIEFELCASGPDVLADPGCDEEACCFGDGSCQELHRVECENQGGTPQGFGTDCDPNPCPQPGACCLDDFPDNTCDVMFESECTAQGGSWRGEGTDCETAGCTTVTEACCFSNGSCYEYPPSDCLSYGATPMGAGTTCVPNPCPQP